jgi:hypothetical protein
LDLSLLLELLEEYAIVEVETEGLEEAKVEEEGEGDGSKPSTFLLSLPQPGSSLVPKGNKYY